jgi:hypothetical protein
MSSSDLEEANITYSGDGSDAYEPTSESETSSAVDRQTFVAKKKKGKNKKKKGSGASKGRAKATGRKFKNAASAKLDSSSDDEESQSGEDETGAPSGAVNSRSRERTSGMPAHEDEAYYTNPLGDGQSWDTLIPGVKITLNLQH